MELMASREPVAEVLASHTLSAGQEQRLAMIGAFKAYGKTLGLSATDNYETVALHWNRTIWNLTACDPLSFTPRSWWFPIVGRMPYLGYFVEEDARAMEAQMQRDGLEVYVRTAGAYSTLGWFKDPVLPSMLGWSEPDLADTVFHELAHATLWIPGSAMFNESFAEVVGVAAMHTYMIDTYGKDSAEYAAVRQQEHDSDALTALLHALCTELDGVFSDTRLSDGQKLEHKAALYASIPDRIAASAIVDQHNYQRWARRNVWNNARLIQFKTYNAADADFAAILAAHALPDGRTDVKGFIDAVQRIQHPPGSPWAEEPFDALHEAAVVALHEAAGPVR
jgi:predicted aminopeptidase